MLSVGERRQTRRLPGAIRSERSEQSNTGRCASRSHTCGEQYIAPHWKFREKSARVVEESAFAA
jgi:hypothetical protein